MRRHIVRAIPLTLLLTAAAGCQGAGPPLPAPPPPAVTVVQPVRRKVTDYKEFTGHLEAVEKVDIRARVRGFLKVIHFKEGTEVKEGDLLYEIDPREFEATVAKAQADLEQQQAQLELARTEAARSRALLGLRAASQEEYDQRVAARETAWAAIAQARAVLESAKLELSFTRIHSPIDGRAGRTLVTKGNLVGFSEPTLLTTVVKMDPIYVYFEASERDYLEYQQLIREKGAPTAEQGKVPVHVALTGEKGFPHRGLIDFRANQVDLGTGTILLRGELPNPHRLLTPGLYARVRVPIGFPRPRLLVPEVALSSDQRGPYMLVVKPDNTVERRDVQLGITTDGMVVVKKGVTADDWVIVNGLMAARPGATVRPQRAPAESATVVPASTRVGEPKR
ncbi:MAG: efflux RND transporter periplasmic adaptor subunit [Gemmataceae bacterium]|nr:efflux RND transporter periplasmic adaptor subunit [Gemmataceae bacterium]